MSRVHFAQGLSCISAEICHHGARADANITHAAEDYGLCSMLCKHTPGSEFERLNLGQSKSVAWVKSTSAPATASHALFHYPSQ